MAIAPGIAGLWVSTNRILTKSLLDDERGNTSIFFFLSITTILICFVLHQVVRKTDFVQFYITLCQERNRITLEPTEDVGLVRLELEQLERRGAASIKYLLLNRWILWIKSGTPPRSNTEF